MCLYITLELTSPGRKGDKYIKHSRDAFKEPGVLLGAKENTWKLPNWIGNETSKPATCTLWKLGREPRVDHYQERSGTKPFLDRPCNLI